MVLSQQCGGKIVGSKPLRQRGANTKNLRRLRVKQINTLFQPANKRSIRPHRPRPLQTRYRDPGQLNGLAQTKPPLLRRRCKPEPLQIINASKIPGKNQCQINGLPAEQVPTAGQPEGGRRSGIRLLDPKVQGFNGLPIVGIGIHSPARRCIPAIKRGMKLQGRSIYTRP